MVDKSKKISNWFFRILMALGICLFVNILSNYIKFQVDLTEEKRYTLSKSTEKVAKSFEGSAFVQVLLDGTFPAGMKRLQKATIELLKQLNAINPNIEFEVAQPLVGSVDQQNNIKRELSIIGINPTSLNYKDEDEQTQKLIYPYAILNYNGAGIPVNLLESQSFDKNNDVILNNSVSLLEYKFADALQKLSRKKRPNILVTEGNGELENKKLGTLFASLKRYYDIGRINLDSIYQLGAGVDLLIVPAPKKAVSLRSQFIIDQYVMNGGKIIWLIEKMEVDLLKINESKFYVPPLINTDLDDLFFRYGVRIQPNLILDLECSQIMQVIGMQGEKVQTDLYRWYYHPLIASRTNHPIVHNLERINMFFPSTIDTIKTNSPIKKTILLQSSEYSRFQVNPMRLNFEILKYKPDPDKFNKGPQNVAVLLEGRFDSFFKNRVGAGMHEILNQIDASFMEKGRDAKQLFISDIDFTKNLYSESNNQIYPIGFNKWEQFVYKANEEFMLNAVAYLVDNAGVLDSRTKDVKLRMLDGVKIKKEKLKWQLINIAYPLIILFVFSGVFFFFRRRKYAK